MPLSNTATPKYYGMFRDAVLRGDIPVCEEISMEMNRIDALIENPGIYYDELAMDGYVQFCEDECTNRRFGLKSSRYFQALGRASLLLVLLCRAVRVRAE